jgi:hypothetical protein
MNLNCVLDTGDRHYKDFTTLVYCILGFTQYGARYIRFQNLPLYNRHTHLIRNICQLSESSNRNTDNLLTRGYIIALELFTSRKHCPFISIAEYVLQNIIGILLLVIAFTFHISPTRYRRKDRIDGKTRKKM